MSHADTIFGKVDIEKNTDAQKHWTGVDWVGTVSDMSINPNIRLQATSRLHTFASASFSALWTPHWICIIRVLLGRSWLFPAWLTGNLHANSPPQSLVLKLGYPSAGAGASGQDFADMGKADNSQNYIILLTTISRILSSKLSRTQLARAAFQSFPTHSPHRCNHNWRHSAKSLRSRHRQHG
jgi:hypothetical protein